MRQLIDSGWDSRAWIVDRDWLEREPRRPEVVDRLRAEVRLLGWLAPLLPVPVPEPVVVRDEPLRVRHRLIVGEPFGSDDPAIGHALGAFLRTLHGVPSADAVRHGALDADTGRTWLTDDLVRMRSDVLPLLGGDAAAEGVRLLEACAAPPPSPALVHGDLGPAHILIGDGAVSGVIDWTDARIGDPAIDLAWPLFGAPAAVAGAVAEAYGVDDRTGRRAWAWHQLGPWYEVLYGLGTGPDGFVASGLAGVRQRLAATMPRLDQKLMPDPPPE
jgi:aminoglycoside phosphotransferase (APT) family kinase protein